jgi:transposase
MEEMGTALTKNGKRKWTKEQKVNILNEIKSGANMNEVCRKYNIALAMIYRWKKRYESDGKEGLNYEGEVVPKGQYLSALKKIDELERALGRKTLENDIIKKNLELKGIKLPDGI